MNGDFEKPRDGKKTDNAHPPIHPTKFENENAFKCRNESRVYDLIVRHFLGACSKDAIGDETSVILKIKDEEFQASGLVIRERNYLEVYTYEKWSGKLLPSFQIGQIISPERFELYDGKTSPPEKLTEEALIALMDKNGIGTDATIPQHIETIQKRVSFPNVWIS